MTESSKASPAQRFGTWSGRCWKGWRGLEARQLERARASGKRHGALLVRCAFRLGDLVLLAGLLLVGYWVLLPVLLVVGLVSLAIRSGEFELEPRRPTIDEIDHPTHRLYWPEFHDD